MKTIILITVICIFVLCFCIYNWWFQREKFKRLLDYEKEKVNPFNTPSAWGWYSLISIFFSLMFIGYNIYVLLDTGLKTYFDFTH